MRNSPAPSTFAASDSSQGRPMKNCRNMKMKRALRPGAAAKKRILVVEDEPHILLGLRDALDPKLRGLE